MWSYVVIGVLVGMFVLATALVGIRGTSIGQHIGAVFFTGVSTVIATAFIMDYAEDYFLNDWMFWGFILSAFAAWLISYLLVGLIYVTDQRQTATMATLTTILWGIGALIYYVMRS